MLLDLASDHASEKPLELLAGNARVVELLPALEAPAHHGLEMLIFNMGFNIRLPRLLSVDGGFMFTSEV